MQYPYVCLFIGNRNTSDECYPAVLEAVGMLIDQGVREFWSGGYGNFDRLGERAVREWKQRGKEIRLVLVLAYPPKNNAESKQYYARFDELYQPDLGATPARLAIARRNEIIARQAGHVIAGVRFPFGGAGRALDTAIAAGAEIHSIFPAIS